MVQPAVVKLLRAEGHLVYDFKHPEPGNNGFHWSEIDSDWQDWDSTDFRAGLCHELANEGFKMDMDALRACDACVLVLPCGRSAHLEVGWAAGAGKKSIIYYPPEIRTVEPELMYKMLGKFCINEQELLGALR